MDCHRYPLVAYSDNTGRNEMEMLRELLKDDQGFIANEAVKGALFKAHIRDIPDGAFSTKGINKLISSLGISFRGLTYVKPRMDTPCMYGYCNILNDLIAVESQLAWKDIKRIKRENGGIFYIYLGIEKDCSFLPTMTVTWDVENIPIESIKMSPILDLIQSRSVLGS